MVFPTLSVYVQESHQRGCCVFRAIGTTIFINSQVVSLEGEVESFSGYKLIATETKISRGYKAFKSFECATIVQNYDMPIRFWLGATDTRSRREYDKIVVNAERGI